MSLPASSTVARRANATWLSRLISISVLESSEGPTAGQRRMHQKRSSEAVRKKTQPE